MRKLILALSAIGTIVISSCGTSGNIDNKWEVVMDASESKSRDSMYAAQLASVDTLTQIPEEIMNMKKEVEAMPKDSLDMMVPAEIRQMLSFTTIEELKNNLRTSMKSMKAKEDSTIASRKIIYEFTKKGGMRIYTTDRPNEVDTAYLYKADTKKKELYLYGNPEVFKDQLSKDTISFKILHLSSDSLSIIVDSTKTKGGMVQSIKPNNFRLYKETKKADKK